jgi:hypothetical protein
MFRDAYKKASEFTFPVITSRRSARDGTCGSGVATFIVMNKDGWIVTAGHVLKQWHKLAQEVEQVQATQAIRETIEKDQSLTKKERAVALGNAIISRNANDRCSAWWGVGPLTSQVVDISYIDFDIPGFPDVADIGVGRLEPFDPTWVKEYPVFKDPSKNFEPGQSLCKLGFPFHQVSTSWNNATNGFDLAPGSLPMPRFPIEGIFTRTSEVAFQGGDAPPFPFRYVETSSPGLLGQSGGPTFDVKGTVWAIQSKTIHHPLGFSGQSQFLNAGLGVHPDTMFGFFDEASLKYEVSDY